MLTITRQIIDKVANGDSLSDDELTIAAAFYRQTERNLRLLGEPFQSACLIVLAKMDSLQTMLDERRRRQMLIREQIEPFFRREMI